MAVSALIRSINLEIDYREGKGYPVTRERTPGLPPNRPVDRSGERGAGVAHGRAVSPAIGIALLLVITFVIATLLGLVAAQLVMGETKPPSATVFMGSCTTPDGASVLKLQHHGGEVIDGQRLALRYRDVGWRYVPDAGPDRAINGSVEGQLALSGETLGPGDTVLLGHTAADLDLADATVMLVWDDGESGYVLSRWHGSDGAFDGLQGRHCPFPPGPKTDTRAYNVTIGECEWTPGADDSGHGNQCSVDEDSDNPGGGTGGNGGGN